MEIFETPGKDETEFLARLRYQCLHYKSRHLSPGKGRLNTFFIPDERITSLHSIMKQPLES